MGQAWGHVCVMESSRSAWSTELSMGPQWVMAAVQYRETVQGAGAAMEISQWEGEVR